MAPRPRKHSFYGRRQHALLPGFYRLMGTAYLQELFGLPSKFPCTSGPTLRTESVPYCYVQWPYPVLPLFPLFPPWMLPVINRRDGAYPG
ncbi:hypothetical protein MRX96_056432 [Rhipicephalus microplus]